MRLKRKYVDSIKKFEVAYFKV